MMLFVILSADLFMNYNILILLISITNCGADFCFDFVGYQVEKFCQLKQLKTTGEK